jgi:hypothetical protein
MLELYVYEEFFMKKILLLTFVLYTASAVSAVQVNMPGEPSYGVSSGAKYNASSNYKKTTPANNQNTYSNVEIPKIDTSVPAGGDSTKATLDSLARSVLKSAENHDDVTMNKYIQKMMKAGAEGFSSPQIISKQTPHCPPIKINVNGRQMSGSKCALFSYLYKDKQYDVGYCR